MQGQVHPFNRSSITNGRHLHGKNGIRVRVDGRTHAGRRWRDLLLAFTAELGHEPSTAETVMLRQAVGLALQHETRTAALAGGERVPSEELTQLSSELRRVLIRLGLGGNGGVEPEGPRLSDLLRGDSV